ncbi:MAG: hypothetical protein IJU07_02190 [Synergistaceae bacterium]|nr:hypothetical protein [Synergistaceae bacterium]
MAEEVKEMEINKEKHPEAEELTFKDWLGGILGICIIAAVIYAALVYSGYITDEPRVMIIDTYTGTHIIVGGEDFTTHKDYDEKKAFVKACVERNIAFRNCGIYSIAEDKIFWVYNGVIMDTDKKVGAKAVLRPGRYTVYFEDDIGHYKVCDASNFGVLTGYTVSAYEKIGNKCPFFVFEKIDGNYVNMIERDSIMHDMKDDFPKDRAEIDFGFNGMVLDAEAKTSTWQQGFRKIVRFNITNLKPEEYETGYYYGRIKYTKEGETLEVSDTSGNVILAIMPGDNCVQEIREKLGENYCVAVITKDSFK